MPSVERIACTIPSELAGMRLDQALAELLPDYSRARIQQWLKEGLIRLDGRAVKPRDRISGGEAVEGCWEKAEEVEHRAEDIPLDIRFEDEDLLVVNKPAGLVVHPAAGNPDGTLLNALLHHAPGLARLPRAGLVHRLDKDTSGLLVVAKSERAHVSLVGQLQARTMGREYQAVVTGALVAGGLVDVPIGRHALDRKRMSVMPGGKPAVTHFRIEERFRAHTHLRVKLETGRTHQIRVHMAYMRYPLVGDPVYGGRLKLPPGASAAYAEVLRGFPRQALHARRLSLVHPGSGRTLRWDAETPEDFERLLAALRTDLAAHAELAPEDDDGEETAWWHQPWS